jgi:hypothetical protein
MRLMVIACEVFYRELCLYLAKGPHVTDVVFLPKGMHDRPPEMRAALQERIDAVTADQADAVVLAFGLCGNVASGIAARAVPLVIPRAHDCITLFLGSRERYDAEHEAQPGTYYYSTASFERKSSTNSSGSLGTGEVAGSKGNRYEEYVAKYGEDNARYLLEVEASWSRNYTRAAYLRVPELDFLGYADRTAEVARQLGLGFEVLPADLRLLEELLSGVWSPERFLVVPPRHVLLPSHGEDVLRAVPG